MNVTTKASPQISNYRMLVYGRALHPELFDLQARRIDRHGDYESEIWLFPGGHVVRMSSGENVMSETVVESGDHLPEAGLIHALPCLGEKDYEMDKPHGRIGFVTSAQTETVAENIYSATLHEMREFVRETGAISHEWETVDGRICLSAVDIQKYRKELHVQSYHLLGTNGFVLRTQSMFDLR